MPLALSRENVSKKNLCCQLYRFCLCCRIDITKPQKVLFFLSQHELKFPQQFSSFSHFLNLSFNILSYPHLLFNNLYKRKKTNRIGLAFFQKIPLILATTTCFNILIKCTCFSTGTWHKYVSPTN